MTVRQNIEKIMLQHNIDEHELARRLGWSVQRIHHYIKGEREINAEYIVSICDALNTDVNEVFGLPSGKETDALHIAVCAVEDEKQAYSGAQKIRLMRNALQKIVKLLRSKREYKPYASVINGELKRYYKEEEDNGG